MSTRTGRRWAARYLHSVSLRYQKDGKEHRTWYVLALLGIPSILTCLVAQAVGCEDQTVRIISLDPESTLETISLQALTAPPSSICIADMLDAGINKTSPTTFVNIGLQNGVLLRTVLDPVNGQLTDTRTRFLGTRPIRLVRVLIQRNPGILALSSRSWLNYTYQNLMHFTPLIFENLDYAWSFSAELCPEGLIGISGSVLRWVLFFHWLHFKF